MIQNPRTCLDIVLTHHPTVNVPILWWCSVLELLEKNAGWRRTVAKNHAVGIACHESFGTAVACAVDVSIENKRPRIHRATVAVDPGLAVNPLTIESQFQAGLAFGLLQLMAQGAITLKDGRVNKRTSTLYATVYRRCTRSGWCTSSRVRTRQRDAVSLRSWSFLLPW